MIHTRMYFHTFEIDRDDNDDPIMVTMQVKTIVYPNTYYEPGYEEVMDESIQYQNNSEIEESLLHAWIDNGKYEAAIFETLEFGEWEVEFE